MMRIDCILLHKGVTVKYQHLKPFHSTKNLPSSKTNFIKHLLCAKYVGKLCCQVERDVNLSSVMSWLFNFGQVNQSEPQVTYLWTCPEIVCGCHGDDILSVNGAQTQGRQSTNITHLPPSPLLFLRIRGAAHLSFNSAIACPQPSTHTYCKTANIVCQHTLHRANA